VFTNPEAELFSAVNECKRLVADIYRSFTQRKFQFGSRVGLFAIAQQLTVADFAVFLAPGLRRRRQVTADVQDSCAFCSVIIIIIIIIKSNQIINYIIRRQNAMKYNS